MHITFRTIVRGLVAFAVALVAAYVVAILLVHGLLPLI
jgi:hypothetical protein